MSRLEQDWPAYVLLAGVAIFIVSAFIHGKRLERKNKEEQKKSEVKPADRR